MVERQVLAREIPTDQKTGLILPLSKFLGSHELRRHRALIGFELEVLAKKYDRFGWNRDRETAAQKRMMTDWMNALQDFPLEEVKAACTEAVFRNPTKMPNEGIIRGLILLRRKRAVEMLPPERFLEAKRERVSPERAAEIMREAGFKVKKFSLGN